MFRRFTPRLAAIGLVTLLGLSFALVDEVAAAPAKRPNAPTAAAASGAWTLVDNHQSLCYYFPQGTSTDTNYYVVWLKGSWSKSVTVGVSGLSGATTWTYDSPIPPGSSDGSGSLAYVAVRLPSSTANGSYGATLWATDGSSTQNVAVTATVQPRCTSY